MFLIKYMDTNSIFITQDEIRKDINGKITYTDIMDLIPKDSVITPIKDWQKTHKTEWRWRFLKFPDDRFTVEISHQEAGKKRLYFNRSGKWVERDIGKEVDEYVTNEYYYYTSQ